jgi:transcriptional regulator with XRE-family HTH domain
MTERPEPPPWGALITTALARQGLSAREAARRAGLSEGRWRQITGGYQVVSPGVYAQVRGPAGTLARMANAAGVSVAELRAAGRADAADVLASQRERTAETGAELLERVRAMDTDQARELLATIAVQLGISLPGAAGQAGADEDADPAERRTGT